MGTLKTDIITGLGSNNEVTLVNNKFTGSASGNMTVPGEGGTTTTNLQQGLAKVWAHSLADGTGLSDSFNTSGITDVGTGKQQIDIANDFANVNFSVLCSYIENQTDKVLIFIEIQMGTYFGEDDIVRIDDLYERK